MEGESRRREERKRVEGRRGERKRVEGDEEERE